MTVYLPFDDGSSVSFDGESFTVRRRPVSEEDVSAQPALCKAEEAWRNRWVAVTRALEGAWRRQQESQRLESPKQVYNNLINTVKAPRERGAE